MTDKTLTAGELAADMEQLYHVEPVQKYGAFCVANYHAIVAHLRTIAALESKSAVGGAEIETKFDLSETELKRIGYGEQTDTTGLTGMEVLSIGPDLTYQRGRRDATNAILSSFSAHSGGTEIENKLRNLAGDLDAAFHEDAAKDLTAAADELRRMREVETELDRAKMVMAAIEVDDRVPHLIRALTALEEAEIKHANCDDCGGEGVPELCGTCFPFFDDARVLRRNILAELRPVATLKDPQP